MNKAVESLAFFGSEPLFSEPLHVGRPNIGDQDMLLSRIKSILDSRFFTNNGPNLQKFEEMLAEYLDVKHCIACCNGTIALELAIRAVGLSGEVIVPAMTFVATAHALQWQGITPVFVDIDPLTHTLDAKQVEKAITSNTTGIMGVHVWGNACDVAELEKIADKHNLKLLFDAAHAFACSHDGRKIGGFGNAEVFSFHSTKFFNTFEGGAITTNDEELAEKIRLMRNFGFKDIDLVEHVGTNGKMTEVCAAMGIVSFDSLNHFLETNIRNYRAYQEGLAGIPNLRLVSYDEQKGHNFQYIILELNSELSKISRDLVVDLLWSENIKARKYFFPGCHRMEPYRSSVDPEHWDLPVTENVCDEVIALPTGTAVSSEDVKSICALITSILENGEDIAAQMTRLAS